MNMPVALPVKLELSSCYSTATVPRIIGRYPDVAGAVEEIIASKSDMDDGDRFCIWYWSQSRSIWTLLEEISASDPVERNPEHKLLANAADNTVARLPDKLIASLDVIEQSLSRERDKTASVVDEVTVFLAPLPDSPAKKEMLSVLENWKTRLARLREALAIAVQARKGYL